MSKKNESDLEKFNRMMQVAINRHNDKMQGIKTTYSDDSYTEEEKELLKLAEASIAQTMIKTFGNNYDTNNTYFEKEKPSSQKTLMDWINDGNLKKVKKSVRDGADINERWRYDRTPLIISSWNGDIEIVEFLIESGADINAFDSMGDTALTKAITSRKKSLPTVKLLIESGADTSIKNKYGNNILMEAVFHNNYNVVKYFVENGFDVNCKNNRGATPLHYTFHHDKSKIVEYLINAGADINSKNNDGNTPFEEAFDSTGFGFVKYYFDNYEKEKRNDFLIMACRNNKQKITKYLIELGCDVNYKNSCGETPLSIAHNKIIREYLIAHGAKPL